MLFLNEYEVQDALRRVDPNSQPHLAEAVIALANLVEWTNSNSDGWAYWPLPCRAAKNLQALIQEAQRAYLRGTSSDTTAEQVKKALVPVKAFLTRRGVSHDVLVNHTYRIGAAS
jgi:hypothetical protein